MKRAVVDETLFKRRLHALPMEGFLLVESYDGRRPRKRAFRDENGELFAVVWDGDRFFTYSLVKGLEEQPG